MKKGSINLNYGVRGWLVIIYAFLSFFMPTAFMATMQFTVNINAATLGWDSTTLLSLGSAAGFIQVAVMLIMGRIIARGKVKLKWSSVIMNFAFAVACAFCGMAQNQYLYITLYIIGFVCGNTLSLHFNNALCGNWWPTKKGMVAGITTIGLPLGSSIGVQMFMAIMGRVGIVGTYLIYGGIILALSIFGAIVLAEYPEDVGEFPDNDKNMTREMALKQLEEMKAIQETSPWTFKRIISNKYVWLLVFACAATFNFTQLFVAQCVNRMTMSGFERADALTMMTVAGIVACFGSLLCGVIDQKLGTKKAIVILTLAGAVACILQLTENFTLILISMCIGGVIIGGASNYLLSMTAGAWGRASQRDVFGVAQPLVSLIGAALGVFYLQLAGWTNTYVYNFIILLVLCVVSAVLFGIFFKQEKVHEQDEMYRAQDAAKKQ